MFKKLLSLLLIIPVIEMLILIESGRRFGFWPTLGMIIFMGILGIVLIRSQGFSIVGRIKYELAHGQVPTNAVLDGLLVVVSGLLLVTPGLLTDFAGISLLIPPIRDFIRQRLKRLLINVFMPGSYIRIRW